MKITKILVALAFLFSVSTANAGELSVTGSMEVTYQSEVDRTTGNPLGMDRELKFSGSTELDNGITVSVMQDTDDNLSYGNSKITFGGVAGLVDIYVGTDGSELDAVDDITPSAYEEANAMSGTYKDVGGLAGEMGIGAKFDVPFLGTVKTQYVPKADGTKNADNAASANTGTKGSGMEVVVANDLGNLPVVGSYLDGLTITTGYSEVDHSAVASVDDAYDLTYALNYNVGAFKLGYQRKLHNEGETGTAADEVFYKDLAIGVSYAVNDQLSISYNRYESDRHNNTTGVNPTQSTSAINIGYTIGGMTIGFQEASTDNANYTLNSEDDTRTIGVSVAF